MGTHDIASDRPQHRAARRAFGRADERPYRRLLTDWVKLALAVVALVASARHVGAAHPVERDIARFFADLPTGLEGVFRSLLALGTLWGVTLVTVAALLLRRWRLAIALAGAGVLAWVVARGTAFLVGGDSVGDALKAAVDNSHAGRYPTVHLAVLGAVLLAAAPFLSRPLRRCGTLLFTLLVLGALYRQLGSTNAVFAGLVIAWASAAALHLIVGSPAGRPTTRQVAVALDELGVPVSEVALAPEQTRGFSRMLATAVGGEVLPVRVYGRDAAETRFAAKTWRTIAYKDSGPTLTFTRLQQVEHEALCMLRARDAGATVPDLVAVGVAGPSAAVLVTRVPALTPLHTADDLRAVWVELGAMRRARLAHGALDDEHLGVSPDGAVVVHDFSVASISASQMRLDTDVAQLLVTGALATDATTSVQVALEVAGPDVVSAALPLLGKPALTAAQRSALRKQKDLLETLTTEITERTDRAPEKAIELRRVKPLNIVMFVAFAFALWVILAQVGSLSDLWATLKTAQLPWAALGFTASTSTAVAFALVTLGSVPDAIPLVPATMLQMAISFANMVAATSVSSTVMNIRFLQKQGVEVGVATSSGVLAGISGTVAQFTLFIVSALVVGQEIRLGDIAGPDDGDGRLILFVVAIGAVLVGIVLAIPKLRRAVREKVWPQVVGALRNFWGILTTPRQLVYVLGGSFAAQFLYCFCLMFCVLAYGSSLPFMEIVFVNASASFLANLTPVPGGMGIQEAALIAGLTAFGVPPELATAAVITHRLFTTYLPPIWGSWATKKLIADGYL
ncbi:MAG: lysylphosphatidylglycerol synthase transmembrane domain-containing protein [Acidimicrobiia bacterium]